MTPENRAKLAQIAVQQADAYHALRIAEHDAADARQRIEGAKAALQRLWLIVDEISRKDTTPTARGRAGAAAIEPSQGTGAAPPEANDNDDALDLSPSAMSTLTYEPQPVAAGG